MKHRIDLIYQMHLPLSIEAPDSRTAEEEAHRLFMADTTSLGVKTGLGWAEYIDDSATAGVVQ